MRGRQNSAVGAVAERFETLCVLAGQDGEVLPPPAQQLARLATVRAAILQPDDVGMIGETQHRLVAEIDAGPVGNVVEQHRMAGAIGKRAEVQLQPALRRPRIRRTRDQVAVDRPCRRSIERVRKRARIAAGQAEENRKISRLAGFVAHREHQPFGFARIEREAFSGGGGQHQPVDGPCKIVPHQPSQRGLIERAIAERRDQRQPQAMQVRSEIGRSRLGHWVISC